MAVIPADAVLHAFALADHLEYLAAAACCREHGGLDDDLVTVSGASVVVDQPAEEQIGVYVFVVVPLLALIVAERTDPGPRSRPATL